MAWAYHDVAHHSSDYVLAFRAGSYTLPSETISTGLAEFLATYSLTVESLFTQSDARSWGVSKHEFASALFRSTAQRFGDTQPGCDLIEAFLRSLHVADVAFVCALCQGSEPAWEHLVAQYRPMLRAAARSIVRASAGEAVAFELADTLFADLYGIDRCGGERARPLLEYFHGRSKFSTWLRAVLAQRHIDWLRAARRTEPLTEKEPVRGPGLSSIAVNVSELGDPDQVRLLPRFRQALSGAIDDLPVSDRLLLALYYVQELTLAHMAHLRGVHEATVSRQLDRIRRELRDCVAQRLMLGDPAQKGPAAQRGLSPAEIEFCFAHAADDSPFDLSRALSADSVLKQPEKK